MITDTGMGRQTENYNLKNEESMVCGK
jgi:hypothetical protein